jgi:4-hydroxy 2-oxovalerate aldolase
MSIKLLDCTLRDGAYINNAEFGKPAMRGITKKLQESHVDIIECGWLKDSDHIEGSTYFHVPAEVEKYIVDKRESVQYCLMMDWDRYNVDNLPFHSTETVDSVRIVFPYTKCSEAVLIGESVRQKGYKVLFQAANTLAYSDADLIDLCDKMNDFKPYSLSIVDTFGSMYFEDLDRIVNILDSHLIDEISLGFHAHNNQQLAFALCIHFIDLLKNRRNIIVDSTLSGMGRGAGNATTELVAGFIDRFHNGNYDLNAIMDAIDLYILRFSERFSWGYSTPYFISGLYQCHVNNVSYLMTNHRTNARDLRNIIESLSVEERRKYDYELLERKYIENQNRIIDDEGTINYLKEKISGRKVLLVAPGKSTITEKESIDSFIKKHNPVIIEVNSVNKLYNADFVFFANRARYEYAQYTYPNTFKLLKKILLSNITTDPSEDEYIINYNLVVKRGWEHFDNAVILCLRLLNKLDSKEVFISGFDGFKTKYNESYADDSLPTLNPENKWDELNDEIKSMYRDLYESLKESMSIVFITKSIFDCSSDS